MRVEMAAFTASILINTAFFAGVDGAVTGREGAYLKLDGTQFEFVESPPAASSQIPAKSRFVSDKDSVAQDLTPDKENRLEGASPALEKQVAADQLEQKKFDPSKAATAASSPSTPRPPVERTQSQREALEDSQEAGTTTELMPPSGTASGSAQRQPQPPTHASPAAVPSPAEQGLTGRDRITTPAVSRSRSHGAQVYGNTSFEATGSGMGRYMKEMKEKIWMAWFPYLAFHYPKDFRSASATIGFTLGADGRLLSVRVVDSEGGEMFAAFCVEAVQRASPFGPLPAEILDLTGRDDLDAQFVFNFW